MTHNPMKHTLLLLVVLTGCTTTRNTHEVINGLPNDARYCAINNCNHNHKASAHNITDNTKRNINGSIVSASSNLAESITTIILSPATNLTKQKPKYKSLEESIANQN